MPYFEVIYETGAHSVAEYDDENEAVAAVRAHHKRAVDGEVGGPTGHAAERVVKVLMYDKHPNEFNPEGVVTSQEIEQVELSEPGVDVGELTADIRDLVNPTVNSAPHESNYKMPEIKALEGWDT